MAIRKSARDALPALSDRPLRLFLLVSPFAVGLFLPFLSTLASLFLLGFLLYAGKKRGGLLLPRTVDAAAVAGVTLFLFLTPLWAVDKGMAWFGAAEFLAVFLFFLASYQLSGEQRKSLLDTVPLSGCAMTLLSAALSLIPPLKSFFLVSGRLAGFFQYPNTFALFLLLGLILVTKRDLPLRFSLPMTVLLLLGIFLSGSRTVFFLTAATVLVLCFGVKERKRRFLLALPLLLLAAGALLYVLLSGSTSAAGRFLTSSLSSSTLLGRLLYDKDALPVILTHPFGLGYMGYRTLQGSFQTGVYAVTHVHNDLLQLFLDLGILPAGLCLFAFIKSFLRKTQDGTGKLLCAVIGLHCLLDFDLQFPVIGMLLLLAMSPSQEPKTVCLRSVGLRAGGAVVLAAFSLWLGTSSALFSCGLPQAAVTVYPGHTDARVSLLTKETTVDGMEKAADEILHYNRCASVAWSAKARAAFSRGDFEKVISYKKKAISLSKYALAEYEDYLDMLFVGIDLYAQSGDYGGYEVCRREALAVPVLLNEVKNSSDPLAYKINDKPELTLPDAYLEALEQIKQ